MFQLNEIAERIRTQDGLATSDPLFVVESGRNIFTDNGDDHWWYDEDFNRVSSEMQDKLEDLRSGDLSRSEVDFEIEGPSPYGEDTIRVDGELLCRHTSEVVWEFVTACFTMEAAKLFMEESVHRYERLRIFCYSAYRNREMIAIRLHLLENK